MDHKLDSILNTCQDFFKGKEREVKLSLISICCKGHLLLEDAPGVGKTTLAYLLGQVFGLRLSRIQFTNDLLPNDILGTTIFDKQESDFIFKRGPIFAPLILADELNRASPKTQSALLQAMEERYISVEGVEYQLDWPFIVIATQNPISQIGTNPLPESQLDRFFMSLNLGLPSREFEKDIILGTDIRKEILNQHALIDVNDFKQIYSQIEKVSIKDSLVDYILDFISNMREQGSHLSLRSGKDLILAAKCCALIEKRDFVTHDDVQFVAPYILAHRLGRNMDLELAREKVWKCLKEIPLR